MPTSANSANSGSRDRTSRRLLEQAGRQRVVIHRRVAAPGDATRVDEEGFYYIVDRWKDMYISGGENVYPAEVESVLHQLIAIAEAAVIGIPNEQWGEVGMAIVAVKPGHTLTPRGNPCALPGQSGAVQMPAADRVRRRTAAQCDGENLQPDIAKEFQCAEGHRQACLVTADLRGQQKEKARGLIASGLDCSEADQRIPVHPW